MPTIKKCDVTGESIDPTYACDVRDCDDTERSCYTSRTAHGLLIGHYHLCKQCGSRYFDFWISISQGHTFQG